MITHRPELIDSATWTARVDLRGSGPEPETKPSTSADRLSHDYHAFVASWPNLGLGQARTRATCRKVRGSMSKPLSS